MKRLLLSLLLLLPGMAFAIDPASLVRSSFTKTNDTACFPASYITEVIVSSASVGGATTLFNSSWTTTTGQFAAIANTSIFDYSFEDLAVKGICYVTTGLGPSSAVTILYKK